MTAQHQLFLLPEERYLTPGATRPFLKWAGGKQQLLQQYQQYFPLAFCRYFEPFLGGGAVFFHLWSTGRLSSNVFLFDNNFELINTYLVVRDHVAELTELLSIHEQNHSRKYYYMIRSLDRQYPFRLSNIERAARTIYLNRTCYNGLYRVNRKGQFNVPMGSYENPRILFDGILKDASQALQGVNLEVQDFQSSLELTEPGDFLYFDPPYTPISKTASFTSYTSADFDLKDQERLAAVFSELSGKGCLCMLSNSYTPLVLDLYRGFRIEMVKANRAINSNGNARGTIKEVIILNY
jgi:DNA adenine methylase